MGNTNGREACGRCSMSTVVDVKDEDEREGTNPFDGDRIELEDRELRRAVPHQLAAGRVKRTLNAVAERIVYGARSE